MSIHKNLVLIGIIALLLISVGIYLIHTMGGDAIAYEIKTFGQTKHKLTVHATDYTGRSAEYVSVEAVQKNDSAGKKIIHKQTDKNGIIVFNLLPGLYKCVATGSYMGSTDFINLNKDRRVGIKVLLSVK